MAYAIQVPFEGDWLYVTKITEPHETKVETYDTREKAEEAAKIWGEYAIVVEVRGSTDE